ncbi:TTF-type zinc finger protein with HAT dimerization domain-containing protein [Perilla frutescens var. frutescens]|nr:TTF-type zinc finger protein with HAT dimerization domain-containing protein [Perilla frutescens var. frutescens]
MKKVQRSMDSFMKPMSSTVKVSAPPIDRPMSQDSLKEKNNDVDVENLPSDPGLRPNIMSYPPNSIEKGLTTPFLPRYQRRLFCRYLFQVDADI